MGKKKLQTLIRIQKSITYAQSLRSKILPRSINKNHQNNLKMKKVRASFRKFLKIFEIFEIFENFRKFSKSWFFDFQRIFTIFEKSWFREFSKNLNFFEKIRSFFRRPTLGTHNFFYNQRILDFFYRSTRNFMADSMRQPKGDDFTKEKNYFMFVDCLTPNSRLHTKCCSISWNNTKPILEI